jgi:ornithine cyclodeaminase
VAGAVAAKHLAPKQVERIGIVGTGIQARLQLLRLRQVTGCREVLVWGRRQVQLDRYRSEMESQGFRIETTLDPADILPACNLIVTATPAAEPILHAIYLKAGCHITAVGSDTPHKQEVEAAILGRADLVVADSIDQCLERGEIYQAVTQGQLNPAEIVELGDVIAGVVPGRTSNEQITVADLTGVAVQDIKIAVATYQAVAGLERKNGQD